MQAVLLDITPVILAGGRGMRLRPLTSESRPKPLLKLLSTHSLLQKTVRRVSYLNLPLVICANEHAARVLDEVPGARILAEPCGRSTAPAIALAARMLAEENTPMLVLPSDHYIEDEEAFRQVLQSAHERLSEDNLVIFGARPSGPESRYGYIQTNGQGAVQSFLEKPDKARARALLAGGHCFWNTGMFLIYPQTLLNLLEKMALETYAGALAAFEKGHGDGAFFHPDEAAFHSTPSIAIDYALMEKLPAGTAQLVPIEGEWCDLGCWPSLLRIIFTKRMRSSYPKDFS